MKYIITEQQYEQLSEMIKLDIKVGDTILGGKFKNKKVVVKTIDKNDKGDITINGKPLLRFRIIEGQKYKLLRRTSDMKERLENLLKNNFSTQELKSLPLDNFILICSDYIGTELANESRLDGDEFVTFRNQIKHYIRNNFYDYLKEYWKSRQ